jgi:hypothetical protein
MVFAFCIVRPTLIMLREPLSAGGAAENAGKDRG